jgi:hypothetical protein
VLSYPLLRSVGQGNCQSAHVESAKWKAQGND